MQVGKKLKLQVILLTLSVLTINGCTLFFANRGFSSLTVPLYVFRTKEQGILRKQSNEFIPYTDPRLEKEFLAIPYESWREVVEYCKVPKTGN